jgi:hypothetical protein
VLRPSGLTYVRRITLLAVTSVAAAKVTLGRLSPSSSSSPASANALLATARSDLNAAYEGDDGVLGRLGSYYLGIVHSRRNANATRRRSYKFARLFVGASLLATTAELILGLVARVS